MAFLALKSVPLSTTSPTCLSRALASRNKRWIACAAASLVESSLQHHAQDIQKLHLRDLLRDEKRCDSLWLEHDGMTVDLSRQLVTEDTMRLLHDLAESKNLTSSISAMANGEHINSTEDRAVLHTALRCPGDETLGNGGAAVAKLVQDELNKIYSFANKVRKGEVRGSTGQTLTDTVVIGIGGSYLGPQFVYESLVSEKTAAAAAKNRRLRFIANVDPVDAARALHDLNPETTLVIVVSKTFTTAETMRNAKVAREWLRGGMPQGAQGVERNHFVAVSSNVKEAVNFGIDPNNVFQMWDWVGGRFSTTSAVGMLPLSIHYSPEVARSVLQGARSMDKHFFTAPISRNIPIALGLVSLWNSQYLGLCARALLPYASALHKLPAHIQQVAMESNGKRVHRDGTACSHSTAEIDFGEPGTNGQHSFYQLLHQGRVVPADFIGFIRSQNDIRLAGDSVTCHDELMANFFAQPDALALGKTELQLRTERVPEHLIPHKTFPGNRPSTVMLVDELTGHSTGQLLALFEHRTAVQGFLWGLNSFDQFGVELGKVLAGHIRSAMVAHRKSEGGAAPTSNTLVPSTARLLSKYLSSASS